MAHYQITLDSSTLHQLFLGGSADPGMKPMLESILNHLADIHTLYVVYLYG